MYQPQILAGAGLLLIAAAALADPPFSPCEQERAGWPMGISRWAIPSNTPAYCGGYVGGGCASPHHGEDRTPEEGTWGWDYQGWVFCRRVFLSWWRGLRCQGGTGQYQTDGPKLKCHEEDKH